MLDSATSCTILPVAYYTLCFVDFSKPKGYQYKAFNSCILIFDFRSLHYDLMCFDLHIIYDYIIRIYCHSFTFSFYTNDASETSVSEKLKVESEAATFHFSSCNLKIKVVGDHLGNNRFSDDTLKGMVNVSWMLLGMRRILL